LGAGWLEGCTHLSRLEAYLESSLGESPFNNQVSRTSITMGQPIIAQHKLGRRPFHLFNNAEEAQKSFKVLYKSRG
jgi:hypothetical protein